MIHAFQSGGYNIVLDVNSGAVHVTDELTYLLIPGIEEFLRESYGSAAFSAGKDQAPGLKDDITSAMMKHLAGRLPAGCDEAEVGEAVEEILKLREEGSLYSEDTFESYVGDFKKRPVVVKALCLNIAHECNLACRYCFAGEGEYRGKRALMSAEVARAALDFLVKNSGARKMLEVDFFGGEPLLNKDVVKEAVRYGRELEGRSGKKFRFTLTTNGTLLDDEFMEFANEEMDNIVLSIDGRKEVNDRMRPYRGATGASGEVKSVYDTIVPKYLKMMKMRDGRSYFVRGTYTRFNKDFSEDVKHLADLGFDQISVEPVVAKPEDPYSIREEDIPELKAEYDRLAKLYLDYRKNGKPFSFFHFNIDLEGGPCVAKRLSGCGSGCEYLGVTPWGDLYPCHQFVGDERFIMGNVYDGVTREDIRAEFLAGNVYTRDECKNCFARYYCSGGCAANNMNFNGDVNKVYREGCELQRKRIECAIMIKVAESEEMGQ
ncbi:MAG: thioether cross-link-forming SCIFF peptide maturase [Lachnospiraceae bacterium]|nr:thioether cross-link-forming SCIFF peptide maturase [Lachnospiraceae bacterium]